MSRSGDIASLPNFDTLRLFGEEAAPASVTVTIGSGEPQEVDADKISHNADTGVNKQSFLHHISKYQCNIL